jgi:hypothetical protein
MDFAANAFALNFAVQAKSLTDRCVVKRWHCTICGDFDLCDACHSSAQSFPGTSHLPSHPMTEHAVFVCSS